MVTLKKNSKTGSSRAHCLKKVVGQVLLLIEQQNMPKMAQLKLIHVLYLTRVNSTNVQDEGLWIGGRATTRDSGIEIGT
jgi:hypothetical protein